MLASAQLTSGHTLPLFVPDAPCITEAERAHLARQIGRLWIGDALVGANWRVERWTNAADVEYYRLSAGGASHTWHVFSPASLARIHAELLARLVELGATEGKLSPYDADLLCDDDGTCENAVEYGQETYTQEALALSMPALPTSIHEHGGEFISISGHLAVDQRPFVSAVVKGSKHISRDFATSAAKAALDPFGDREARQQWIQDRLDHPIPLDQFGKAMWFCSECLTWQRREAFSNDRVVTTHTLRGGTSKSELRAPATTKTVPKRVCKTCDNALRARNRAVSTVKAGREPRGYRHLGRTYFEGKPIMAGKYAARVS